jgi:hypothetical protein
MNPLIPVILKILPNVLPRLLPMADTLVERIGSNDRADGRLREIEHALGAMSERCTDLERRIQRARALTIVSLLLSIGALVTVWAR